MFTMVNAKSQQTNVDTVDKWMYCSTQTDTILMEVAQRENDTADR